MRTTRLLLICICCLGIAVPTLWGQAASGQAMNGILGYLDPRTGAFRAVTAVVDDSDSLPAAIVVGGTVTLTITITVKTTGLTNFTCSASITSWMEPSVRQSTARPTRWQPRELGRRELASCRYLIHGV